MFILMCVSCQEIICTKVWSFPSMCSSRHFIVQLLHVSLIFCLYMQLFSQDLFKKLSFPPPNYLNCLGTLLKINWWYIWCSFFLFHWCRHTLFQYHIVLFTVAYSKSWCSVSSPILFFPKIILAIQGILHFHVYILELACQLLNQNTSGIWPALHLI